MIIDTDNYDSRELSMFFDELSKKLKTKRQYAESNPVSRKGVDIRLKSMFPPQTYDLCGIVLISDSMQLELADKETPLKLIKTKDKYF